jgi:hypothetical protein
MHFLDSKINFLAKNTFLSKQESASVKHLTPYLSFDLIKTNIQS